MNDYFIKQKFLSPIGILTLLFMVSRIFFYVVLDLRFDVAQLESGTQIIDTHLLKNNLFQSLWYLHTQPPIYNLFLGIILKFFPTNYISIFHGIYLLISWASACLMYQNADLLKVGKKWSFAAACIFMFLPSTILYENWLFYTPIVAFEVLLVSYFFLTFHQNRQLKFLFYGLLVGAMLVLTRNMFHLIWLLFVIIFIQFCYRFPLNKLLKISWLPVLLVCFWYGKNAYLFGKFTACTWLGMNISNITLPSMRTTNLTEKNQLNAQIQAGKINRLAQFGSFAMLDEYRLEVKIPAQFRQVPLLTDTLKSTDCPNYHHFAYIAVSDSFQKISIQNLKKQPLTYLKNALTATIIYLIPPSKYPDLRPNYSRLQPYSDIINLQFIRKNADDGRHIYKNIVAIFANAALHILFLCLTLYLYQKQKLQGEYGSLFLLLNILYIAIIANLLEIGEGMRFRYQVTPISICYAIFILKKYLSIRKENA